jgi:hypothetical protein
VRVTAELARFFAPVAEYLPPSGRVAEFRTRDGQLEQLGPDNRWARYVPFARLRQIFGPEERHMDELPTERPSWRQEARERLEAKAAQRRAEAEQRTAAPDADALPARAFYWAFGNRDGSTAWYRTSVDLFAKFRALYGVPEGRWSYGRP